MKTAFKTYLSLIFVLLLNAFASLQANDVISSITDYAAFCNFNASEISIENNDSSKANANLSPLNKNSDNDLLFEFIESSEGEDEELSSSHKSSYKDYLETLFIYAKLFENTSKELQKNSYRPQSDINEPALRLHLQFQVFII